MSEHNDCDTILWTFKDMTNYDASTDISHLKCLPLKKTTNCSTSCMLYILTLRMYTVQSFPYHWR